MLPENIFFKIKIIKNLLASEDEVSIV